jgi:hypothetical protein
MATVALGLSLTVFGLWLSAWSQTHTFPALDTNNAFTGNETHGGTETFTVITQAGNLNNIVFVDGVKYPTPASP